MQLEVPPGQRPEEYLLNQNGVDVEQWLQQVGAGDHELPVSFNWLGFAELASNRARGWGTSQPDLAWARVAILVYGRLAEEVEENSQHAMELSAMLLRAYLISRLGAVPGDAVLDPAVVLEWFVENVLISPEQARQKTLLWHTLSPQERVRAYQEDLGVVRELRRMKNRLGVVHYLLGVPGVEVTDAVKDWLALDGVLP